MFRIPAIQVPPFLRRLLRLSADLSLAALCCGLPLALSRFGIRPLVDSIFFAHPVIATSLNRTFVLIALLGGYWFFTHRVERRHAPAELQVRWRTMATAALAGALLIGLSIGALLATGHYRIEDLRGGPFPADIVSMILIAATFEEVTFRAVLFRLLEKHTGTISALATGALLFGGMHLANPGVGPLTWLSVSLLGVMWAGVFALTRNLWAASLNHACWNLTIFLSGLPLSGQAEWREAAPLETSVHGSVWATGGEFGPEDAWLTILLVTGACAWIIRRLALTGRLRSAAS